MSPSPSPRPWFTGSSEPSSSSWSSCWSSWEWLTVIGTVTGINTSCVGAWAWLCHHHLITAHQTRPWPSPYIIFIAEEVRHNHNQHTRSSMPPLNWSDMGPGKINTVTTWPRRLSEIQRRSYWHRSESGDASLMSKEELSLYIPFVDKIVQIQ